MAKNDNLKDFLTDVADAIREKKGTEDFINPQDFSEEIKNLPSGGTEVEYAFGEVMVDKTGGGNSNVTSVVISNDVETINTDAYRYFSNLKQVNFGDSIKTIKQYAFNYCATLESVVLPKSISSIGLHAFAQCVNLRHFEIPIDAPITNWNRDLLWNSPLLRSIVIPKNITRFEEYAIEKCTGIECIDLSNCLAIPEMVNVNAFFQTTGQFIVPDNLYDEWIVATNWSTYADRIVKASEYQPNNE